MKKVLFAFFRSDLWMALASVALAYLMGYMAGKLEGRHDHGSITEIKEKK